MKKSVAFHFVLNQFSRRGAIYLSALTLLAGFSMMVTAQPQAQAWPTKPIRLVVSFPPGSSPDVVGRAIAVPLSKALGQPVVVENRSGATGLIGSDLVAKSPADGYTILMTSGSSMAISVHTVTKMPFDPKKDLVPVAAGARIQLFLVAHPSLGAKNFAEFIAHAKSKPGKLTYASPGNGSAPHVATEMLKSQAMFFAVHVPYRGAAPALQDLLGGVTDFAFDPGIALSQVRAGKLNLLAVGSSSRSSLFPNTPTLKELGLKDFDADTTHAFYAPAGTPANVIELLNREINLILATPQVIQQIRSLGAEPTPMTPQQLRSVIASDSARYSVIVKERGIKED